MRRLFSLGRDERGTAIIEMAAIAPVLALMTIGVVDMSNAFGKKMKLEQAAQRAIEKIMNTTGETTVEATIAKEAATQAEVPETNVTVKFRVECNGAVSAATDCADGEKEEKWISVEVRDSYTPMFPVKFAGIDGDKYDLVAKAGVRVE